MKWTYFLINLFSLSYPLLKSFESKLRFYSRWRFYLPSLFLVALFFIVWDYLFVIQGVWRFNEKYIFGLYLFHLPPEEIMFFVAIPYACTFIYEAIWYFRTSYLSSFPVKPLFITLSLLCLPVAWLFYGKLYTFYTSLFLCPVLISCAFLLSQKQLENAALTFLISLIPMAIVNGLLTSLPVLIYNNAENCGIRAGTIPLEDFGYAAILLFLNILIYERLQNHPHRK